MSHVPPDIEDYFARSPIALALASMEADNPLVLVNDRFCKLTGYRPEEVVGQNCRFLQRDADNEDALKKIHTFLRNEEAPNVRTTIVNFRKDGTPFINLLYMSKLRGRDSNTGFLFASQFDVSRSQVDLLAQYDAALARTLTAAKPLLSESGLIVDGSLITIANSATVIAQAKLLLATLNEVQPGA